MLLSKRLCVVAGQQVDDVAVWVIGIVINPLSEDLSGLREVWLGAIQKAKRTDAYRSQMGSIDAADAAKAYAIAGAGLTALSGSIS